MKNFFKKPWRALHYLDWLAYFVLFFLMYTFLIYATFRDDPLYVYIGNILLIATVLVVEKVEVHLLEKLYNKLKKDTLVKRQIKKHLAKSRYRPTFKAALYLFYIVCLIAGRLLYYTDDFPFISASQADLLEDYFSGMYYVLILLVATDKFTQHITKESKDQKKYYAKYDDEDVVN